MKVDESTNKFKQNVKVLLLRLFLEKNPWDPPLTSCATKDKKPISLDRIMNVSRTPKIKSLIPFLCWTI